jgi:hypothetical protein
MRSLHQANISATLWLGSALDAIFHVLLSAHNMHGHAVYCMLELFHSLQHAATYPTQRATSAALLDIRRPPGTRTFAMLTSAAANAVAH